MISYIPGHLESRHLQLWRYHHVSVDDKNEVVTFRLWNLSGQLVGFQQYRPWGSKSLNNDRHEGKYFTCISFGQTGVWGVETLHYQPGIIFVCEGVFDACRIHNLDLPAIAVFGNNPLHLIPWLKALGRRVVAVPDDDAAGKSLANIADEVLDVSPYLPSIKKGSRDLGRLKDEQVERLLAPYV